MISNWSDLRDIGRWDGMGRDGIDGGRDRERDRDEDGFFEGGDGRRNLVILGIPWDSPGLPMAVMASVITVQVGQPQYNEPEDVQ